MEDKTNEKAARLEVMLQKSLYPITERLENIEQKILKLDRNQEEIKRLLMEVKKS
ncbi:hypothetical protein [Virgibacillus phasianinus]|uniref:hypothetical protein n=1 Tax=Virgibacillus phasianinus TaxID=2017483 RepID=UPI0012FD528B|nr:hypothetical protein [Virgibacillus phasianinus]